ncbi:diacylglycerol kinase epsilon-like [Lethenteron reissneri]|uniref:diacylglycerol kinase epsilon-like n=1 Tax=Lethenteron reissneri TaxID=7753 RepID=UPI002AB78F3D|nr:diacylglycerol kinase epsilon-like [Lethenteron reissneri]
MENAPPAAPPLEAPPVSLGLSAVALWTCVAVASPVLLTLLYRLYRRRWPPRAHGGLHAAPRRRRRQQPRWRRRPPSSPAAEGVKEKDEGEKPAATEEEEVWEEEEEDEDDSRHSWDEVELFGRPAFCCVCAQSALLHVSCCHTCGLCAHGACVATAEGTLRCKARCSPAPGGRMRHLWVRGAVPLCSACAACGAPCGAEPRLCDARCAWCRRCVHDACRPRGRGGDAEGRDGGDGGDGGGDDGDDGEDDVCDLGPLRGVIIPPPTLHAALRQR